MEAQSSGMPPHETPPPAGRRLLENLYRWWAADYPPLDGRLRFVVYGLLLWMWRGGAGWITGPIRRCPPDLFEPQGAFGLLNASTETLVRMALAIETPLIAVWACAALGLFGRVPIFLTGVGVALTWGVCQGCQGSAHTWHAPMYLLLVCGCFARPDRWSLDSLISRRWPDCPFNPSRRRAPDLSGFGCKLALLFVVYTLFAGGLAKLWHGGWEWLDGQSLHFYLVNLNHPRGELGRWTHATLLKNPPLVTALAWWTVFLEVASLLALFSRSIRWPLFINAWAFHLGIWLVMLPAYWPQMACYLLLVPWGRGRTGVSAVLPSPRLQYGVVGVAMLACVVLVATIARQREWFPLSHVPMYSSYVSAERIGSHARGDYGDIDTLTFIAATEANPDQPWWIQFELARRVRLSGKRADDGAAKDLCSFPSGIVDVLLWSRRISYAILDDVRTSGHGSRTTSGPYPNSQRVFDALRSRILGKAEWSEFDTFELFFTQDAGDPVVLAVMKRE